MWTFLVAYCHSFKNTQSRAEDCSVGKSAIKSDGLSSISATHMGKGLYYSASCPLPTYLHIKNVPQTQTALGVCIFSYL